MAAKARALTTTTKRTPKARPRWVRRLKRFIAFSFLLFLIAFTAFGVVFVNYMRHASELIVTLPEKLQQFSREPTRIIGRDGKLLFSVQSEFREPIKYEDIPKHVRDAIVAAEDKRFYDHSGVDYWAMGRILAVGAKEGRLSQGGSTLTMQLAKRFYSEGERTFTRKLQDVTLAISMERDMSKDQILTLYLNTMYFGERAYGIQAASEVYFGKKVDKLTLGEAAMLARCVRRPSDVNPVRDLEASIENRNTVLGVMRDESMITTAEYQDALAEEVKIAPRKDRVTSKLHRAPYFVDHVLKDLEADFPDVDFKSGGYTIYTTIDTELQSFADKSVQKFLKERMRRGDNVNAACFVLLNKDGQILCEVGGQDYQKSQFNIVTQGMLQPGSAFKAFLYSAALSTGAISMGEQLENTPYTLDQPGSDPWTPKNSSRRENEHSVSVYKAFTLSYNIPAARVIERVGPLTVKSMAMSTFGIRSLNKQGAFPSMALGAVQVHPLEMAEGYTVFMLHGNRATPYCITKVVGPDGNIVRSYSPRIFTNQLDPWVVAQMDELLHGVVTNGTASGNVGGYLDEARGKTGTTTANKDAWFCGFNQGVVAISWCGNMTIRNGQVYQLPMASSMYGGTAAAIFWRDIVKHAVAKGFGSKIPEIQQPSEPIVDERDPGDSETRVNVIPPEDKIKPDGTTGGEAPPGTGTDPGTTTTGGTVPPPITNPDAIPTDPPVRRDPPKRHDDDSRETQVEICAESGMKATIYCPETVTRSFRKGQEPRKRCTIHGG